MADNEKAILELAVEVREGLANIKRFESEYRTAIQQMAAATKAGMDPASAEFAQLRARVAETGAAFLAAGDKGGESMRQLAALTGKETAEMAELRGKIGIARVELDRFHKEGVSGLTAVADKARVLQGLWTQMLGVMAAIGVTAGFRKLTDEVLDTVKAAGESEVAYKKLEAIIRATGSSAEFTAEELADIAAGLQNLTGTSDETIQQMEAVFVATKKVSRDAMPELLERALDIATLMEGDASSAADMLAKAYARPAEAAQVLRRAHIELKQSVLDEIKTLAESGHEAEAQSLLLTELKGTVGGLAREVGETLPGSIDKAKEAFGELKEEVGAQLTPALKTATDALTRFIQEHRAALVEATRGAGDLAAGSDALTQRVIGDLEKVQRTGIEYGTLFRGLLNPLSAPVIAQSLAFRSLGVDLADVTRDMGLTSESSVVLGEKTRSLDESLQSLAEHTKKQAEAERERASAIVKTTEALKENAGIQKAALGDEQALRDAVAGSDKELGHRSEVLLSVVSSLKQHGEVNKEVTANIREETEALLNAYAEVGKKPPADIQRLADAIKALSDVQKDAAEGANVLFEATTQLAESRSPQDGGSESSEAEKTVAALKKKQEQGGLTADELERLFEAEDEVSRASTGLRDASKGVSDAMNQMTTAGRELTDTEAQRVVALENLAPALAQVADETTRARTAATAGADAIGLYTNLTQDQINATEDLGRSWAAAAEAGAASSKATAEQSQVLSNFTNRQADFNNSVAEGTGGLENFATQSDAANRGIKEVAESAKDAGPKLAEWMEGGVEGAKHFEDTMIRINSTHLPESVRLAKEFAKVLSGADAP